MGFLNTVECAHVLPLDCVPPAIWRGEPLGLGDSVGVPAIFPAAEGFIPGYISDCDEAVMLPFLARADAGAAQIEAIELTRIACT